ncbi:MAG: deoxyribonuclease V [Chromatiaceae bacterium]
MPRDAGDIGHSWDVQPRQAREIQDGLRCHVVMRDELAPVRTVAGVDVGFEEQGRITRAAIAVLRFPSLEPLEEAVAKRPTCFPYVPGLLSFREIPAVLDALADLSIRPDLILCDGQGYAHPRRFGLACHLGVVTDLPSIGVAKSRLVGECEGLGIEKGSRAPLRHEGEVVGVVLRTRGGVRPLYVSIGHRVSLDTAVDYVLACTTRYRLPETTRRAHRLASEMKPALSASTD